MLIKREVSDGVIAPGFTDEALKSWKQKKNGNYNVIKIDPDYQPAPLEHKEVFGITFEQGKTGALIDDELLSNIVTENKEIPANAHDGPGRFSDHTWKYTQSNSSVCFVKSRTGDRYRRRPAVQYYPVPVWQPERPTTGWLRQCPKVLDLQSYRRHPP